MKKVSFYIFILLVCSTAAFYSVSHPATVLQHDMTVTYSVVVANVPPSSTPGPTIFRSATPTTTPKPTATTNFPVLVDHYLTPFTPYPTQKFNPNYLTPKPTPTDIDVLRQVSAQTFPVGWTPTPPPYMQFPYYNDQGTRLPITRDWRITYIQAATDLMNSTNANQGLFLNYVDTWSHIRDLVAARWERTWFLKNDFDNDGQPEWLVSVPVYSENGPTFCCSQIMILFEKMDGLYHPVYYQADGGHNIWWQLLHVADLNQDGSLEVVTSRTICGSGCGYDLDIGAWDGQHWKTYKVDPQLVPTGVSFFDTDHNGTTEIVIQYTTFYKLRWSYPARKATHIYSWQDGQFRLVEAWLQPNVTPLAVAGDASEQLLTHNFKEVLRLAQPVMDKLPQQCELVESAIALQVMVAYAFENQPEAMQATLTKMTTFCHEPEKNGFIQAAGLLWATYQKTHDPLLACETMQRFIRDRGRYPKDSKLVFDSHFDYRNYCLPNK